MFDIFVFSFEKPVPAAEGLLILKTSKASIPNILVQTLN